MQGKIKYLVFLLMANGFETGLLLVQFQSLLVMMALQICLEHVQLLIELQQPLLLLIQLAPLTVNQLDQLGVMWIARWTGRLTVELLPSTQIDPIGLFT